VAGRPVIGGDVNPNLAFQPSPKFFLPLPLPQQQAGPAATSLPLQIRRCGRCLLLNAVGSPAPLLAPWFQKEGWPIGLIHVGHGSHEMGPNPSCPISYDGLQFCPVFIVQLSIA
jgi:hypothetical protein